MNDDLLWQAAISLTMFAAVFLLVKEGWASGALLVSRVERYFDRALNQHLLLDVPPRVALGLSGSGVAILAMLGYLVIGGVPWLVVGGLVGAVLPGLVLRHMEQKRAERLEEQLVDGITTLSSGVRAGLNLVQSMELLVNNSAAPIRQEVGQLLREYQMGLDLNHAMHNAANRIGSSNYRLLFTALEMHRRRGGDMGESLDRIAESVREIQRLEGKLDALTAQGRTQARMMASMPVVILLILYGINPEGVVSLLVEPMGRVILLVVVALIVTGFVWINRIMAVDI